MSYQDSEVSVHGAKPVELFKFEGTYANFFYTSGPEAVNFLGDDYEPLAIKRTDVRTGTQEDDGLDVTVEVPASSDLAQTYGFSQTPPRLYLTVYRYHRGAPGDYVAYWTGPVLNISTSEGKSTLRSPSALAYALLGNVPNVYYQTPCNHVLYDARCGLVEGDWTEVTTTVSIDGNAIEVVTVGALDGMLIGGELSLASGERRMITAQAGNVVTVNFPFFDLEPATAVSLVAGCDHAYGGDCSASRFDNQIRFGGFPFIPNDNVFESGMEPGKTIADNTCLPFIEPLYDHKFVFSGNLAYMRDGDTFDGGDHEAANITVRLSSISGGWGGGNIDFAVSSVARSDAAFNVGTDGFFEHASGVFSYYFSRSSLTLYIRFNPPYTVQSGFGGIRLFTQGHEDTFTGAWTIVHTINNDDTPIAFDSTSGPNPTGGSGGNGNPDFDDQLMIHQWNFL